MRGVDYFDRLEARVFQAVEQALAATKPSSEMDMWDVVRVIPAYTTET